MAYDFVGEEFGMGSAAQLFCAMWCWPRSLGGIVLADGLVCRVQNSITQKSSTLV
jgi:hypothetical protein